MANKVGFKQRNTFESRFAEATRVREKFPDRIPVIIEKSERSNVPSLPKNNFLVTADTTVGELVYVIRKAIKMSAEEAIFLFVDDILPPVGASMSSVYQQHKHDDGFLYITYCSENTFGNY